MNISEGPDVVVTLDLNSAMLEAANELGMDVSEVANRLLTEHVRQSWDARHEAHASNAKE